MLNKKAVFFRVCFPKNFQQIDWLYTSDVSTKASLLPRYMNFEIAWFFLHTNEPKPVASLQGSLEMLNILCFYIFPFQNSDQREILQRFQVRITATPRLLVQSIYFFKNMGEVMKFSCERNICWNNVKFPIFRDSPVVLLKKCVGLAILVTAIYNVTIGAKI